MAADQPKIVAYMKPVCGWSQGVRAVLGKYDLDYEDKDIVNDPYNYAEMVRLTGQYLPALAPGRRRHPSRRERRGSRSISAGQGHRPVCCDRGDCGPARLRGIGRRLPPSSLNVTPPAPGPAALHRKTHGAG